jgi:hypothetical protein
MRRSASAAGMDFSAFDIEARVTERKALAKIRSNVDQRARARHQGVPRDTAA